MQDIIENKPCSAGHLLATPKRRRGFRFDAEKYERERRERGEARERQWIAEMDAMHPRHGYCYFIGDREAGLVKIGFSRNLAQRLSQLRSNSGPYRLELLAKVVGGSERELHYHRKFEQFRFSGEWFHLTAEIEAEISRIVPAISGGR